MRAQSSANASSMPPASNSRSGAAAPSPTRPKNSSPVVAWLASNEADYVTGQVIRVIHDKLIWMGGWYERADVSCEGKPWDAEKLGAIMATDVFETRHRGMVFGPIK